MTNEFGQRVFPVIRYVVDALATIRSGSESLDPQMVAAELRTLLAQFDVQGDRRKEFLLARRALVYWIDEVLVLSNWEFARYWSNNTLERSYFDSRERATQFFDKADQARSLESLDALETFYLCACFGFMGVYRSENRREDAETGRPNEGASPEETWDPEQEEQAADESVPVSAEAQEEAAAAAAASKDDWWESGASWENDEPADSMIANVKAVPASRRVKKETFQEWIDSVYRQLSPSVQHPYTPENPPSELGQASPLEGRPALVASSAMLILGVCLSVGLIIWLDIWLNLTP